LRLLDGTGMESQAKPNPTGRRRGDQAGDGREPLPIERGDKNRGLPPRPPGPPHRRTLGKPAFVQENQQRVRVPRFFF
jgi:hypothetical protein